MEKRTAKVGMMALLVLVHCVSLLALDRSESRALYSESRTPSQQQQQQQHQQQRLRLSRKLNTKHNEVSVPAETNKKTSHVLSGGHLRSEVTTSSTTSTTTTQVPPSHNDTSLDDDGLLLSSASELGPGQVSTSVTSSSTSSTDDEDKKTLSQQVKEGKYGLIQNEIFAEAPKRPGILSYAPNPEVPRDTAENLGGLDKDEIWLAENHVLVLKGGGLPEDNADDGEEPVDGVPNWPPIDDYEAPRRQVKIPAHPRVPPPFPVQLTDGGPVQLLAANGSSIIDNNASISIELLPDSFRGFLPGEGPYFPQLNTTESPPLDQQAQAKRPKAEFYPALPPGAVVVPPPPANQSDYDDEDQSIYYPPPYSFVYHQDNSTDIPPGPLVPGIILPPPPDFFSVLDDDESAEKEKLAKAKKLRDDTISVFLPSVASQSNQLGSTSGQPSPSRKPSKTYKTPAGATYASKTYGRSKFKSTTYTPKATYIEVTTSTPPSIQPSSPDPLSSNQVFESSTEKAPWLYTSSEKTTWFETSTEKPRWREASPSKNTWFGSSKQPNWFEPSTAKPPPPTWHQSTEKRPAWRTRNKEKSNWFKTSTEKAPWRVSSAPVPLVSFFASTTPNSVEQPVESTPAPLQSVLTTEQPPQSYPSQASYYFYEEAGGDALSSTPAPLLYFGGVSAEPPAYYKLESDDKREYYDVELVTQAAPIKSTAKAAATPTPTLTTTTTTTTPSPLASYQSSVQSRPRLLPSEPIYYHRPVPTRSQPKLTYFATTPKSKIHYYKASTGSSSKSKPIYQYSFEASNYARPSSLRLGPEPPPQQQLEPRQVPRRPKELPSPSLFATAKHFGETIAAQTPLRQSVSAALTNYGPSFSAVRSLRPNSLGPSTIAPPPRDTTLAAHQQYFTKQDELLLDDVTKEYFTVFGKKLPASTTPIYGKSSVTERPSYATPAPANGHRAANVKVHYGDHTPGPSLVDDILVNFKQPLPSLEPQAEFVPLLGPSDPDSTSFRARPRQQSQQQPQQQQQRQQHPIHHLDYGQARTAPDHVENHVERPNSYFAYRLPGDGGHFYFLTPQAIGPSSREDPYHFFSRPGRLLRRRRRPDSV